MKKLILLGITIVTMLSTLVVGCNKPPVNNLNALDEFVTINMTLDQVYDLLKPELKQRSILYKSGLIELTASGNWKVWPYDEEKTSPVYNVLFFTPLRVTEDYYMVFFEDNIVVGKGYYQESFARVIQAMLQGINLEGIYK